MMAAIQSELDSMDKNGLWELCDFPIGKCSIGKKWGFNLKHRKNGSMKRYKTFLVAKGYVQQKGIDYEETFAPPSCIMTICTIVALVA